MFVRVFPSPPNNFSLSQSDRQNNAYPLRPRLTVGLEATAYHCLSPPGTQKSPKPSGPWQKSSISSRSSLSSDRYSPCRSGHTGRLPDRNEVRRDDAVCTFQSQHHPQIALKARNTYAATNGFRRSQRRSLSDKRGVGVPFFRRIGRCF